MKGRLAPLPLKPAVIATVIPQPQPNERHSDNHAVDDGTGSKIKHEGKSLR
jgi:hypothetical protein